MDNFNLGAIYWLMMSVTMADGWVICCNSVWNRTQDCVVSAVKPFKGTTECSDSCTGVMVMGQSIQQQMNRICAGKLI